ncbi:MAG: ABC transporter permease [Acidobacteria bacterium]|nr:ABC transporter permease [Acidobacteriota bacterium]
MAWIGEIWRRVIGLVRRDSVAADLEEEMRLHREARELELVAGGMERGEARYAAARAFGNGTAMSERGREAWGWRWLEDFFGDLKFGARMLRKNPGFAATAILTLALGIGANTAIFSVVNTVLLQPLPYRDPGRLVWAGEFDPNFNDEATPNPEFANWALNNHTFEKMGAMGMGGPMTLTKEGTPEQVMAGFATPSLLQVLGVQPELGRWFTTEEGLPDGPSVALLSNAFWRRKFNSDPNIVGKGITLDQDSYTVVGVMPASFRYPARGFDPDVITVFQLTPKVDWNVQGMSLTRVIGRLKPGVTLEQAKADLTELSKRTDGDMPAMLVHMRERVQTVTMTLHNKLAGDTRSTLLILSVAVGAVLLIACVNIANLQLARTANRQKELAVRCAIGASRLRLLRQLLTEGALIAALGGIVGLAGAAFGVSLLQDYAPENFLQAQHITIDRWVLLFLMGITCVTVVLFAAIPSLRESKPDVDVRLKDVRDTATSAVGQRRLRNALATCELALAVVLVAASGLLLRSFVMLSKVDPGFQADNVLTVGLMLPSVKYQSETARNGFYDEVMRRVKALPGVREAGLTTCLPLTDIIMMRTFELESRPGELPEQMRPPITNEGIDANYLATLRVPLLAGREFEEIDSKTVTNVVIVNQAFVQKFMEGDVKAAVGKRLRFGAGPGEHLPWQTIVGVAGNVRRARLDREADPLIYMPHGHGGRPEIIAGIAVRTDADPRNLAKAVRDVVLAVDPEQPVFDVKTLDERVADASSGTRFNATLLGFFGFVALALAAVGVYGVIAYSVAERTHEIGIRVALGASRGDVAEMVMSQGLAMTVGGLVIGLAGALFATRYMATLLYGIAPRDPVTFGAAAGTLAVVALAACYLPARRAMTVDPMIALRHE